MPPGPGSLCSTEKVKSTAIPARSAQVQVPEIGRAEIAGEWLIPRDEVLLVGFGPHTVADKDGKAVVRERLAMITASEVAMPAVEADAEPLRLASPDAQGRPAARCNACPPLFPAGRCLKAFTPTEPPPSCLRFPR